MSAGTVVIGIGDGGRGDDGAGIAVARRLRARSPSVGPVLEASGEMTSLLDAWTGYARVVLIDAAAAGAAPGTVSRFEAHRAPLPASLFATSSHSLGPAQAIEMARSLGLLPAEVIVYAIEGSSFDCGGALSAPVREAVGRVENEVLREIARTA